MPRLSWAPSQAVSLGGPWLQQKAHKDLETLQSHWNLPRCWVQRVLELRRVLEAQEISGGPRRCFEGLRGEGGEEDAEGLECAGAQEDAKGLGDAGD